MAAEIRIENLASLAKYYDHPTLKQNWSLVFNLPVWLQAWWEAFGAEYELCLYSVWQEGALIGIAPLMRRGEEARLLGSPDVCDYLDFVAVAGKESDLLKALIPELQKQKIKRLILNAQRPDSVFFKGNSFATAEAGDVKKLYSLHIRKDDNSYELLLASSWEDYLAGLNKKQRHEIRRKLRRLEEGAKSYRYRVISGKEEIESFIPCFFDLFQQNPEKADFFTENMERYFRLLITAMAEASLARFGLLEIDDITAAAVFYFDYRKRVYLYNSGYRSDYSDLSVGLLSKILCIRDNIDKGRAVFDFLKGEEIYKSRLGGTAIPIHTATLSITQH